MPITPRRYRAGQRRIAYSQFGLQVLLASIAAHIIQIVTQTVLPLLFVVNVAALFYLRARAQRYLRAGRSDFDAVIAAEMIVAFGVLSLILGITAAVTPLFIGTATLAVADLSALAGIATPFLEGLATAGLAPFFAVLLRIEAHEAEAAFDSGADLSGLAAATHDLTREVRGAFKAMRQLGEGLQLATGASTQLAHRLDVDLDRIAASLAQSETRVTLLATAAETSTTHITRLADEASRLNAAASEAGTMLAALGDLIESVERFVKPGTGAGTGSE